MVWGLVRVSIFTTAFLIGTMLVDSDGVFSSAASSQPAAISNLESKIGTSLVVACDSGQVRVRHLNERAAVHFECERSHMVVIRDHNAPSERIPEFRLLQHQVYF